MLYVHFGFLVENPSNLFNKSFLLLLALALVGLEHSNSLLDLRNTKLLKNCKIKISENRIEKKCLVAHLALEGVLVLKHVDELGVVDLEKHSRDLARQVGEHALDEGNEYINVYPIIKNVNIYIRPSRI